MSIVRSRRERWFRVMGRRVANPVMRRLLEFGVAPQAFALLETTGRRSGRARRTPVNNGLDGHEFWLVAQNGQNSDYVLNLLANPRVRIKVRRRWHSGSATLIPGDDSRRRRRIVDRSNGLVGRLDSVLFWAGATDLCTIRIDLTD